jgi:hypothetical protein
MDFPGRRFARFVDMQASVIRYRPLVYTNITIPKMIECYNMLIAQMLWYFIEGYNCRVNDDDFTNENHYQKYNVLIENR